MSIPDYQNILAFWFGETGNPKEIIAGKSELWWRKDEETDRFIKENFQALHAMLCNGELDRWKEEARGRLAMIILADQFSRNMYRDQPMAFTQDPLALNLSMEGIALDMDKKLNWIERCFFYMPLEHSEDLEIQDASVEHFRALVDIVPGDEQDLVYGHIDFAIKHWDIIKRFGRYPHRNRILGRASTPEEEEFLKQPGSFF